MVKVGGSITAAYIIAHRPELLTQYPDLAKAHPELFTPVLTVQSGIASHKAVGTPIITHS